MLTLPSTSPSSEIAVLAEFIFPSGDFAANEDVLGTSDSERPFIKAAPDEGFPLAPAS